MLYVICFLLLGVFTNSMFSQVDTIHVVTREESDEFNQFELQLLNSAITILNQKSDTRYVVRYHKLKHFHLMRPYIKSTFTVNDFVVGAAGFTIVENSDFSYSLPYFPVKNSLITLKHRVSDIIEGKELRMGYIDSKYYLPYIEILKKRYRLHLVKNVLGKQEIEAGRIDFYLSDSIGAWLDDELEIIMDVDDKTDFIGFIYLKNSPLKEKLNNVLRYTTKSKRFYAMLKHYFGADFSEYYRKTIRLEYERSGSH